MFTVTKHYRDLPAAHRQPNHDGHCRLIHGHNWGFDITFGCVDLDRNGFVIDVGELQWIKAFLIRTFDHTLLLNKDDPMAISFIQAGTEDDEDDGEVYAKVVRVSNCGMEGLAKFVLEEINKSLQGPKSDGRGVHVWQVTCWEDSKNCATYRA